MKKKFLKQNRMPANVFRSHLFEYNFPLRKFSADVFVLEPPRTRKHPTMNSTKKNICGKSQHGKNEKKKREQIRQIV